VDAGVSNVNVIAPLVWSLEGKRWRYAAAELPNVKLSGPEVEPWMEDGDRSEVGVFIFCFSGWFEVLKVVLWTWLESKGWLNAEE
jgi:hypothetical protein